MVRADPQSSFDAAVHHLFRHIGNADELSRNPLARAFLYDASGRVPDAVALADLHACIQRQVEAHYRSARHDKDLCDAERQVMIVRGILAKRRPVDVANEIGVCLRQYYRDRREICGIVGARLANLLPARAMTQPVPDRPDLGLRRAELLAESGHARTAMEELRRLIEERTDPRDRLSALGELVRAALLANDFDAATAALEASRTIVDSERARTDVALPNLLTLSTLRFSRASGRTYEAAMLVKGFDVEATPRDDVLASEVALALALECCEFYIFIGRFKAAQEMHERADLLARRLRHVPVPARVDLAINAFEAYSDASISEPEAVQRMRNARDVSLYAGSSRGVLISTLGLTNHYVNIGKEEEAEKQANEALAIARQTDCNLLLVRCVAAIAYSLLSTKYWKNFETLPFSLEDKCTPGTDEWMWIKTVQGELLKRLGDGSEAQRALDAAEMRAKNSQNRRFHAGILRSLATLADSSGNSPRAKELIEEAIAVGRDHVSSQGLYRIYSAAAAIFKDRNLARAAEQARRGVLQAT